MNFNKILFLVAITTCVLADDDGATESTCEDKSIFCKQLKFINTCKYFQSTRELCPRACGECSVECKRIEAFSRRQCGAASTTPDQCFQQGCCWKQSQDNSGLPACYLASPPIDGNDYRN